MKKTKKKPKAKASVARAKLRAVPSPIAAEIKQATGPQFRSIEEIQQDFNVTAGMAGEATWQIKKLEIKVEQLHLRMEQINEEMRAAHERRQQEQAPCAPNTPSSDEE